MPSISFFWKAGAKVLLFFELTKYFCVFFEKNVILYNKTSMKRLFLAVITLLYAFSLSAEEVYYTADDQSVFPNPERGFTDELGGETMLSDAQNHVVQAEADWFFDLEDPDNAERRNQSLVMLMYYLGNYRNKDLSQAVLQGFDEDMQLLRDHGFKCVLRFAYDWNSKNDADLEHVKRHIAQLTPHLEANKDVIFVLEAGFVGRWGEWYYSSHFGNESQHLNDDRREVISALLAACPAGRFLLVRYPLIKLQYLGDENALTSAQAYSDTDRARIGHHNDAFLNEWGNDGTYGRDGDGPDDDPVLRRYIADETLFVPNGGETNVEGSLANTVYTQAETEMSAYHWSFCGSEYSEDVTDKWRSSGIFDELNRKMGYRLQLVSASFPDQCAAGGTMAVSLTVKNVGYAPLYNERRAYLVLKNSTQSYSIPLQSDPRRWAPNGALTEISETLALPADMPAGTYRLYLHLPDMSASLAADPRYAVRFANVGTWDEVTGMNNLKASLSVTSGSEGLENVLSGNRGRLILRNGLLLIERNGVLYNAQGIRINN